MCWTMVLHRPHCLLPSRRRHRCVPHCLLELRRSCRCPGRCLWWRWVVHLTSMIPRMRHEGVVSDPALCPAQFSSEILTRDDGQHWPSSVCLSLPDPWSRVVQPVVRIQPDRPSAGLQSSSDMLRCELAALPDSSQVPASSATFAETPLFDHQHLSWCSGHHLRGSLHVECSVAASGDHGTARIPSILSASHPLRLKNSPDVR